MRTAYDFVYAPKSMSDGKRTVQGVGAWKARLGRPPLPPGERRSVGVTARLTIAEARELASRIPPGTSTSAYVRDRLGLTRSAPPSPEDQRGRASDAG